MIEVNGRLWASLANSIKSGVDFPYLTYELFVNSKPIAISTYKTGVKCRWLGGDIKALEEHLKGLTPPFLKSIPGKTRSVIDFIVSFRPGITNEYFSLRDPLPYLIEFKNILSGYSEKV